MGEFQGCPGSRMMAFNRSAPATGEATVEMSSQLRQWPIQLHLVPPTAPFYRNADVLLTADCVAYALGDFHHRFLKDKALAIACPKLDIAMPHLPKLTQLLKDARPRSVSVVRMEVPCCGGLTRMAQSAVAAAGTATPVTEIIIAIQGGVIQEAQVG